MLAAVGAASLLARMSPQRIQRALRLACHGAVPATVAQAMKARQTVTTASARCAGENCLTRSLATVLLCRMSGIWPDWCTGVRINPFRAHAWVQVAGQPIGEPYPPGYFRPVLTITVPTGATSDRSPAEAGPTAPG
ncbi:MAG: lasso peptide biosynthesis B2 protein [Actinomadura sp.]